jgi:peptide-methionine (S)-S-oxide reductase
VGTQYRSAIYYHDESQRETAEAAIAELGASGSWKGAIVTEVAPFEVFYGADDYHKEYYRRNQTQPYCQIVISPKLAKFRKKYASRLKEPVSSSA